MSSTDCRLSRPIFWCRSLTSCGWQRLPTWPGSRGSSRDHPESGLRCYLAWCAECGLDPLAARCPHLELYPRVDARGPPLQTLHRLAALLRCGRVLPELRHRRHPKAQSLISGSSSPPRVLAWFFDPGSGQAKHRNCMAASPGQFGDLGPVVTAEGSHRSKITDGVQAVRRPGLLLGLPYHQIELVALRVGERGLADRRHARRKCLGRQLDLVERLGAQGG
jgi:hypothetical protein